MIGVRTREMCQQLLLHAESNTVSEVFPFFLLMGKNYKALSKPQPAESKR
jgi:hypothetical protein